MRRLSVLFLFFIILFSCTPQTKVESAVKSYLMQNLDNPKSYSAVDFTSFNVIYPCDDELKRAEKDTLLFHNFFQALDKHEYKVYQQYLDLGGEGELLYPWCNAYNSLKSKYDSGIKYIENYPTRIDSLKRIGVYHPIGYEIVHRFRATNKFNAVVLQKALFHLSSDFEVKDVTMMDQEGL